MADSFKPHPLGAIKVQEDSLVKRYGFKLGASMISLPISFAQQWFVTRAMGPSDYGRYSYLNSFFTEVIAFFDSGTSIGFYTKLCARPNETGLVTFYWCLLFALSGTLFALVALIILPGWGQLFWPAESGSAVILALLYAVGIWVGNVAGKIADAHGQTRIGEKMRLISKFGGLGAIALLFLASKLTIDALFALQIAATTLSVWLLDREMKSKDIQLAPRFSLQREEFKKYGREFWKYSHPLLTYSLSGMIAAIADRWLLQHFSGSAEQGFYGMALQIGSLCLMFTSAMIPLLARDFSKADQDRNLAIISSNFELSVSRFYAIAAFLGVFMAVEADYIILALGGERFSNAGVATALMCLYPIHQTCGQINGTLFYSTGQTRLYRNIGLFNIALGLILTVWLLGPAQIGGLSLGSVGLATKMVVTTVVAVNVQLWIICRQLNLSFWRLLRNQTLSLLGFSVIAVAARGAGECIFMIASARLIVASLIYVAVSLSLVWILARSFGLDRGDLEELLSRVIRKGRTRGVN